MQPTTSRTIFRTLWQTSQPYRWQRAAALVVAATTFIVSTFVGPLIIARLLDIIQSGYLYNSSDVWSLVGMYTLSQLWSEVIGWRLTMRIMWPFTMAMQRDLYTKIFAKLSHESISFHANHFGGALVSQANKLAGAVDRFWDVIIWSVLPLVISLVGSIIVLATMLWQYALFLALFSVIFSVVVYVGSKPLARLSEQEAEASNTISGQLTDMVSNILAVKSSSSEILEQKRFAVAVENWRTAGLSTMRTYIITSSFFSTVNTAIKIGAIVFAVYAAQHSTISVATVYLIITYTNSAVRELWNMNGIMRNYNRILGDAQTMVEILHTPAQLVDTSDAALDVSRGAITFDHISFAHDDDPNRVLFRDFSLQIEPNQKLGLVGTSGAGKTTLTKLLLRFYDPTSGAILIDGQDIRMVTQESLRQQIAYVPQEPLLFHRSIRENIAYGRPEATQDDIILAAKQAHAWEFIAQLPEGLETVVGERGVKLSGGQRQRIAIARAILKDAPLLVLDEATSALDSESEALIQQSLETLMQGRTSIVVAHRLSTIAALDRIVVVDEGHIVEEGSHDELLARGGIYARLWSRQSGGFLTNESNDTP